MCFWRFGVILPCHPLPVCLSRPTDSPGPKRAPGPFTNFHCIPVFPPSPFSLGKDIVSTDKHERTREAWQIRGSVGTVRKKGQYVFNEPCVIFFSVRLHSYQSRLQLSIKLLQLLKLDLTNICVVCPFYSVQLEWREVEKWGMMQWELKRLALVHCTTVKLFLESVIILISNKIRVWTFFQSV